MNTKTLILQFSFGTLLFFTTLAALTVVGVSFAIIVTHNNYQAKQQNLTIKQPANVLPSGAEVHRPMGDIREAELEKQFGAVNKDKLHEVKEGVFDRMRARRSARQASACTPQQSTSCGHSKISYRPIYRSETTYVSHPVYVPVTQSTLGPPEILVWNHPYLLPTSLPKVDPDSEPMPEIDPSSVIDGTVALRPTMEFGIKPTDPNCPDGTCPLRQK